MQLDRDDVEGRTSWTTGSRFHDLYEDNLGQRAKDRALPFPSFLPELAHPVHSAFHSAFHRVKFRPAQPDFTSIGAHAMLQQERPQLGCASVDADIDRRGLFASR